MIIINWPKKVTSKLFSYHLNQHSFVLLHLLTFVYVFLCMSKCMVFVMHYLAQCQVLCSAMFILRLSLWCHQGYSPSRGLSLAWLLAYLESHLRHLSGYIWFEEDLYLSSHYVLTILEWEIKKWKINFELSEWESLLNKVNTPKCLI